MASYRRRRLVRAQCFPPVGEKEIFNENLETGPACRLNRRSRCFILFHSERNERGKSGALHSSRPSTSCQFDVQLDQVSGAGRKRRNVEMNSSWNSNDASSCFIHPAISAFCLSIIFSSDPRRQHLRSIRLVSTRRVQLSLIWQRFASFHPAARFSASSASSSSGGSLSEFDDGTRQVGAVCTKGRAQADECRPRAKSRRTALMSRKISIDSATGDGRATTTLR